MKLMKLKKLSKDEKGFTLIELLAVIVILAVIAVIAVPLISNIINKSKQDSDVATANQIYQAARMYVTAEQHSDYVTYATVNIAALKTAKYLDTNLYLPSTKAEIDSGTVTFASDGTLTGVTLITGTKEYPYTAEKVLKSSGAASPTPTPTPGG
ncbi:type II secretion system protein [Bacillus sp. 3255]|uniref:type II secretion system protein n=1 Tax=Bacillus sp. 3255 TaxID=2817904 RepID=UPI002866770C|nr:type II secretion system protein [Bacillus sp. 3255]MDR6882287.1 type IV pilus assembly protein PilA [Bacillus sp. 3255]